ncbi:hypothetical protein LCY76_12845 [Fictibacillus sp. KIGAM418]|uniref:YpoC-like domain-containing protein n=1 Tax=Fictibacillus marinisediminis TaxID=2878389 RepID=A0A9X1XBD2_9BACL|nr:hypothetical protein [Fictibacillus marinisediminis]MCK6257478.1 hypothetical protein [Fictibacillus marinisediminis]
MLKIPESMRHPLFFGNEEQLKEGDADVPFLEELLFYNGMGSSPHPQQKQGIEAKFMKWEAASSVIRSFFSERNRKEARNPMIFQLSCFLQALMWCNGQPAGNLLGWKEEIQSLDIKPVNVIERLEMICSEPDHYHSYIQLNELFQELQKKVAAIKHNG